MKIGGWRCPNCGGSARPRISIVSAFLGAFLFVLFIIFAIIVFGVVKTSRETPQRPTRIDSTPSKPIDSKPSARDQEATQPQKSEKEVSQSEPQSNAEPVSPAVVTEQIATTPPFPPETRTWRAKDGREILGRIDKVDSVKRTIDIIRSDGEVFMGYPISNLHPDDAALIHPEVTPKAVEDTVKAPIK